MDVVELEALAPAAHYVRHRHNLGELTRKDKPADDFRFTLVRRGKQNRVALRAKNQRELFLRHRDARVHLEGPSGPDDEQFVQDSTFRIVPGLADAEHLSFASVNVSGAFLRHRDFHLYVEAGEGPEFERDATFVKHYPSRPFDPGTALEEG
jgi:hypothetical protein